MYLCICKAVGDKDFDRFHLIGTGCGKCVCDGGELGSTGAKSDSGELGAEATCETDGRSHPQERNKT
jgi:hypothetical protein